ncbi:HAMP domain-containing histidine kinase [Rickettsiales bacterium]|nr:HAMP domain-containing histidine kinase [Rickettsiales bacterium]
MFTKNNSQEEFDNLKSLTSSIAHESRNSLAGIEQASKIIKENLSEINEFFDLIQITASRGLQINEIILKNISDGKIDDSNFVNLSIAKIVKIAINDFTFEDNDQRKLVNIDLENDFNFKGDETLMIYVLYNLLKNALHYKVKINIWLDSQNRQLHFKDEGIGIDKDKLESIFDSFITGGKSGGTGLGLPFCKRAMNAFGGDIICQSEIGDGAEFILKF